MEKECLYKTVSLPIIVSYGIDDATAQELVSEAARKPTALADVAADEQR